MNLSNYEFEMSYEDVSIEPIDENTLVSHYRSVPTKITHTSFDGGKTVFDDYDTYFYISNKSLDRELQDPVGGLRYYADIKKLLISKQLDMYIDDYHDEGFDGLITYYNNENRTENKFLENITTAKQSFVTRHYYANINTKEFVLFENLPKALYKCVNIAYQAVMYSLNEEMYFCRHQTQEALFRIRDEIVTKGLSEPLPMKLLKDHTLLPIGCEAKFVILMLMNFSSIPVAIIPKSEEDKRPKITRFATSVNKEKFQELLEPYIII